LHSRGRCVNFKYYPYRNSKVPMEANRSAVPADDLMIEYILLGKMPDLFKNLGIPFPDED
jgi:hypothetical protein